MMNLHFVIGFSIIKGNYEKNNYRKSDRFGKFR